MRASHLAEFVVPRARLTYPRATNLLSTRETERVFLGDDLASHLSSRGWITNPFRWPPP